MSLGFEQAGFDIVSAVEIDPVHAAAHHYNFPNCTLIPHSVTGLTGDSIREKAGLGDAQIDLVCGGAPCQGFSLIGKRVIDDPRNLLVRDFVRLVKELDARSFVFENVKGLTVGKHKKFLKELIQEFTKAGYDVLIEPMVLNAAHYGVPQHRERLFLLGVKKGQTLPSYPLAITRKPKDPEENGIPCVATAIDAIGDLPNAESFSTLNDKDSVTTSQWGPLSSYGKEMRCFDDSAWHNGYERIWQPETG